MGRPLILPATASVAMTVIASRAETVRPYERKDGTHVSTYDRNSSRTGASAPTPASSLDYNAIHSARDAQQNSGQIMGSDGQISSHSLQPRNVPLRRRLIQTSVTNGYPTN
jgi:hypothetical protein